MNSFNTDYRDVLRDEFAARCSRNRLYSLRAFARDLDLRPSHLSDVLRGKLGLSARSAMQVASAIGMSEAEGSYFVTLVEASHARSASRRKTARQKLGSLGVAKDYQVLEERVFEIISDWHHYALLELVQTDSFVPRLSWIAERLGITRVEVESVVRRLKGVGLLSVRNGKWLVTNKFPATRSGIPSKAIKKFHSQILTKATDALYSQAIEQRDFSSITFAINPDDIAEIKEALREFRRGIEKKFKARTNKREVYSLSIQLFSLTEQAKVLYA